MPQTGTIAIVGASSARHKFGNKCVRAYAEAGWTVYPIHPAETEIEGLAAYSAVSEVPVELDRISVYLRPELTLKLLPELVEKGAGQIWFNPGSADTGVLDRARELGLPFEDACSIVDIGVSPSRYP